MGFSGILQTFNLYHVPRGLHASHIFHPQSKPQLLYQTPLRNFIRPTQRFIQNESPDFRGRPCESTSQGTTNGTWLSVCLSPSFLLSPTHSRSRSEHTWAIALSGRLDLPVQLANRIKAQKNGS